MNNIKVVVLISGVEVVASVEEDRGVALLDPTTLATIKGYKLSKPYRILPVPLPMQGPKGIHINMISQMLPLSQAAIETTEFYLTPEQIIGQPLEANQQTAEAYFKLTTGFVMAAANSLPT